MSPREFEHDLDRIIRNDEEMQRIYTFWRRYLLFLAGLVCGLTVFTVFR